MACDAAREITEPASSVEPSVEAARSSTYCAALPARSQPHGAHMRRSHGCGTTMGRRRASSCTAPQVSSGRSPNQINLPSGSERTSWPSPCEAKSCRFALLAAAAHAHRARLKTGFFNEIDDERTREVGLAHSSSETSERSGARRRGGKQSQGAGPRRVRTSKAPSGRRAAKQCHMRRLAYERL